MKKNEEPTYKQWVARLSEWPESCTRKFIRLVSMGLDPSYVFELVTRDRGNGRTDVV